MLRKRLIFFNLFTMAKEAEIFIKLQVKGGQANPAPPIGPALGSKGVNIMEFCKRFNAATQDSQGKILPVIISVYKDKSFDFAIKTVPAAAQLAEAAKIGKVKGTKVKMGGSAEPNRKKMGKVTWEQVRAIAENKMPDLNCFTVESAMKMVAGTARSMGLTVEGTAPWA
jgi:large subunit ribosomal protein L11